MLNINRTVYNIVIILLQFVLSALITHRLEKDHFFVNTTLTYWSIIIKPLTPKLNIPTLEVTVCICPKFSS